MRRNQEDNISRTSVICDPATGEIVGFVSLSAAQVERARLPETQQCDQFTRVPAALLSHLAVDRRYQGRGCGRSLVFFALTRLFGFPPTSVVAAY